MASQTEATDASPTPWVNASEWQVREDGFSVEGRPHRMYCPSTGAGSTQIVVWGTLFREDAIVSEYSIFHDVTPPAAYAEESEESNEGPESEEPNARR